MHSRQCRTPSLPPAPRIHCPQVYLQARQAAVQTAISALGNGSFGSILEALPAIDLSDFVTQRKCVFVCV